MVTYTRDYAEHSDYLTRYIKKLRVIPPPVVLPAVSQTAVTEFENENNPQHCHPVIGMAARFATEKGVEVLLDAFPAILQRYPQAQIQFAGPYSNIIGEEDYFARLSPRIEKYIASGNWRFMGSLSPEQMAAYYPKLDVLVLPSLNSTEAFGLVQIEAMINGVPCVASNLPGVRQPVMVHGMGQIAPIGDARGLAEAVLEVLDHREKYQGNIAEIAQRYQPATIAAEYEKLFDQMQHELHP
jgi:glycosyltransferase involved in cell wall biosynthesis